MFDRIAVISRGEPAMRLTRAFSEADDEAVPRALLASGASAPPPILGCGSWRPR